MDDGKLSIQESKSIDKLLKNDLSWNDFLKLKGISIDDVKHPTLIDYYIDSSETNDALICLNQGRLKEKNRFTHLEIEHSLLKYLYLVY